MDSDAARAARAAAHRHRHRAAVTARRRARANQQRAALPGLTVPELNDQHARSPCRARVRARIVTRRSLVAVPSPTPCDSAPPVFTVLRRRRRATSRPRRSCHCHAIVTDRPCRPSPRQSPAAARHSLPLTRVPVLNTSMPLTPAVPAFALRTDSCRCSSPCLRRSSSTRAARVHRAATRRHDAPPPAPLVPLPTLIVTAPPVPPVAAPEPISSEPLDAALARARAEDQHAAHPAVPAFAVRMTQLPLDRRRALAARQVTAPPVCTVLRPAQDRHRAARAARAAAHRHAAPARRARRRHARAHQQRAELPVLRRARAEDQHAARRRSCPRSHCGSRCAAARRRALARRHGQAPPVCTVLRPASTLHAPPAPLVPLPRDQVTRAARAARRRARAQQQRAAVALARRARAEDQHPAHARRARVRGADRAAAAARRRALAARRARPRRPCSPCCAPPTRSRRRPRRSCRCRR